MTTTCRVEFPSSCDGRPRREIYATPEMAWRRVGQLLARGCHEDDIEVVMKVEVVV
jgi:hypothetical protein